MADGSEASPAPAGEDAMLSRPKLLSMSHVDKIFGRDVVALKDMNLDVRVGDFISLLGPSGGEGAAYLRALAGGHIFSEMENPAARITAQMTPEEIFKVAIDLEVAAVVFYQGIREVIGRESLKGKLDAGALDLPASEGLGVGVEEAAH